MVNLKVIRKWPKAAYTVGRFYVGTAFFGNSMEDADRGLWQTMPLAEIQRRKIWGQTAIPKGTYVVKLTYSSKFATRTWGYKYRGLVPQIVDVPGFEGIRIHPGSTANDTSGCILVGINKRVGMLLNSTSTYYKLMDDYLMPAYRRGEGITITIE